MRLLILPLFIAILFSGCVIKQKNQSAQNNQSFNDTNRFKVPNMNQKSRYSNEKFFLPNDSMDKSKTDQQLKKLMNEKQQSQPSYTYKTTSESTLNIDNVKVENEIAVPSTPKLNSYSQKLDTTNRVIPETIVQKDKMAEELEENIVHVQMQGSYNGYVYPVSMRKKIAPKKEVIVVQTEPKIEKKPEVKQKKPVVEKKVATGTQQVVDLTNEEETKDDKVVKEGIIQPMSESTEGDQ